MKINWKVRMRNKPWLMSFTALVITFVYDLLAMLEVVPAVSEERIMGIVQLVLTLLTALGVLIDPTTQGVQDSERAMLYVEPGKMPEEE